ncbi:hypothetical protein EFL26_00465 [Nocardioides pocheonensis]|uniref:Uncharacterized protein n=1 Tax=Nocardioides pocheonensis TaxID=661485 RepID=A0A3N0GY15_9ACTN|nr:hypothetical protein EFL26_00465 [Nocardioides pocheonensis]
MPALTDVVGVPADRHRGGLAPVERGAGGQRPGEGTAAGGRGDAAQRAAAVERGRDGAGVRGRGRRERDDPAEGECEHGRQAGPATAEPGRACGCWCHAWTSVEAGRHESGLRVCVTPQGATAPVGRYAAAGNVPFSGPHSFSA